MKQGFTLIELLIVIVLLGLAIALVGPLTIEQVENARARNEQQKLTRWLQKQSFTAFARQQAQTFLFDGKAIYLQHQPQGEEPQQSEQLLSFHYLFFTPQQLIVNQSGFVQPASLWFSVNGREKQLDLTIIFGVQHES